MVQYYYPVFLSSATGEIKGWVNPEEYGAGPSLMEHTTQKGASFVAAVEMLLTEKGGMDGCRLVWAGDYADKEPESDLNLYKLCTKEEEILPEESDVSYYGYIVNHTKGQFVSKERVEKYTTLNPLPLLTAEGCGRGVGDYKGDHKLVGYWARDSLSLVKKKPEGLVEIIFDLA